MAKNRNTVKHTMVTGRKYKVYKFEGGSVELLDTVETEQDHAK